MRIISYTLCCCLALGVFLVTDLKADTITINWGLDAAHLTRSAPAATLVDFDTTLGQFRAFSFSWDGMLFDLSTSLNTSMGSGGTALQFWQALLSITPGALGTWGFLLHDNGIGGVEPCMFVDFPVPGAVAYSAHFDLPRSFTPPSGLGEYGSFSVSVPEPSTFALLLVGMFGVAIATRRYARPSRG